MAYYFSTTWCLLFAIWVEIVVCVSGRIGLGSRLYANNNQAWVSENGTFAFGFAQATDMGSNSNDERYQLGIWFADVPGDRTLAWSAYL
ncbi:putative non-specific serine/threonine protein kinase [Helianthus anomalus]